MMQLTWVQSNFTNYYSQNLSSKQQYFQTSQKQKQQQNIQVICASRMITQRYSLFFSPYFFEIIGDSKRANIQKHKVLTETIRDSSTYANIIPEIPISMMNLKQYQNSLLLNFIIYLMNQNPGLTYHNVDSYIENEGFFCYEQYTRLDMKQIHWEENLQNLTDDLIALISEYVDLENLEIFLAMLEFLDQKIKNSTQGTPYFDLRDGLNQTSLFNFIQNMLENIEQSLKADQKDYRVIDYPGLLKLEDVLNFLKGCPFFQGFSQKVDQLFKIWRDKKLQQTKIKK